MASEDERPRRLKLPLKSQQRGTTETHGIEKSEMRSLQCLTSSFSAAVRVHTDVSCFSEKTVMLFSCYSNVSVISVMSQGVLRFATISKSFVRFIALLKLTLKVILHPEYTHSVITFYLSMCSTSHSFPFNEYE